MAINFSDINFSERVENLIKCPFRISKTVISGTGNIVVGVTGIALRILPGDSERFEDMENKIDTVNELLPNVFKPILRVIKPNYPVADELESRGWLTNNIALFFIEMGMNLAVNNEDFINKHIFSRGVIILGFIVEPITRVADLALGLLAASLSILTFGNVKQINTFAMQQLTFFGLIGDVCYFPIILLDPSK